MCRVAVGAGAGAGATTSMWQTLDFAVAGSWAAFAADVDTIGIRADIFVAVDAGALTAAATMTTGRSRRLVASAGSNGNRKSLLDTGLSNSLAGHHAIIDGEVVANVIRRLGSLFTGYIFGRIDSF
jgi:hypothetical protein